VIPGVYTLKLTVDGKLYTSTVTVINDPRVGQSPELMASLRTQNRLTLLSVEGMKHSFAGYDEVDVVKKQLASLLQSNLPDDVAKQAKTLDASLTKIGGVVPPPGGGGGANRRPPDPNAMQSFADLNNSYNTMVSMIQVGLDMTPTPTQIATWEKDCANYNRTLAAWNGMQQQIKDFNAVLTKNNLQELNVRSTGLTNASCSFNPEQSRKVNK
jgi:hypothetical protein